MKFCPDEQNEWVRHFKWPRYWIPIDKEPSSISPFLIDPDAKYGAIFSGGAKRLADLSAKPFLILIGEPAAGKTTAVRDAISEEVLTSSENARDERVRVDTRGESTRSDLWSMLDEAIAGRSDGELFIDGIDECPLSNVALAISQWISSRCPATLGLRILCRTSAFTPSFRDELLSAATSRGNEAAIWKLAPLREADVDEIARDFGFDADDFKKEIGRVGAWPFAAMAGRLSAMAATFANRKRLADSQWEMFEEEVLALCQQERDATGPDHLKPKLGSKDTVDLLSRIAATSIFCGASLIWTRVERDSPEGDLRIFDVADRSGDDRWDDLSAEEAEVFRVLGLAPLTPTSRPGEVTWRHRQTAEFLAARYLINRGVSQRQIKQLILDSVHGRVPPQLHGVAAMLGSKKSDILRLIAVKDPHVALRADLQAASERDRQFVADRLLTLTEADSLTYWEYSSPGLYSRLQNSMLAESILRILANREDNSEARRLAASIAEEISMPETFEALREIAADTSEPVRLRIEAVQAIGRWDSDNSFDCLRALTLRPDPEDKDSDIKGCALRALWPAKLKTSEVLTELTHPTKFDHLGYYRGFVDDDFVPGISDSDIPLALTWALNLPLPERINGFKECLQKLISRAYTLARQETVRQPLARLILSFAEADYSWNDWPWIEEENQLSYKDRRALASSILALAPDANWKIDRFTAGSRGLLTNEDFGPLLDEAVAGGDRSTSALRMAMLLFVNDPPHVDAVLTRLNRSEEFDTQFAFLWKPIPIASEEARAMRKHFKEQDQWRIQREDRQAKRRRQPDPTRKVRKFLTECEKGKPQSYWQVEYWLRFDQDDHVIQHESFTDVTNLPGWKLIDEKTQARIISAAWNYISQEQDHPDQWINKESWYRPDMAGYRAIRLMVSLDRPVPADHFRKWAVAIAVFRSDSSELHDCIVSEAFAVAEDRMTDVFLGHLDHEAREHGYPHFPRSLADRFAGELGNKALELSKGWSAKPQILALEELVQAGNAEALTQLRQRFAKEQDSSVRLELALLLIRIGDSSDWALLWEAIQASEEFGIALVGHIATIGFRHAARISNVLTAEACEAFYSWIEARFPSTEDVRPIGAHSPGLRESIQDFRNALLRSLQEAGTVEAVAALERLKELHPDHDWLFRVLLSARITFVEKTWLWLKPAELRSLLTTFRRTLARHDTELLAAVQQSIEHLQEHLYATGMAWQLWDERESGWKPKAEERFSDFVSDWLSQDLRQFGVVSNREIVARKGERFDIHVEVISQSAVRTVHARVIVEAKLSTNSREVWKAMESQLLNRYMKRAGVVAGLYLIGFTYCDALPEPHRRSPKVRGLESWIKFFEEQAGALQSDGAVVESRVLDIGIKA